MFNNDMDGHFRLTAEKARTRIRQSTMALLYVVLGAVVLVTGTHAIMLVMSQAPSAAESGGLFRGLLNAIRISFPIVVETAAVVVALGFATAKWRDLQKWVGMGVEVVWAIFAGANMVTFFRIERGLALDPWMSTWVNYGLPLSALIAGILVYAISRVDPNLKRKDEEAEADEEIEMIRFSARRDVAISNQRKAIERQRAWIDFVNNLRNQGYSDQQIQFMMQDTPQLLVDKDRDGTPDILERDNDPPRMIGARIADTRERPALPADPDGDFSSDSYDFPPPSVSTFTVHGEDPFEDLDDLDVEDALSAIRSENGRVTFALPGGPYGPGQCVICGKTLTGNQELYCSPAHRQAALRRRNKSED